MPRQKRDVRKFIFRGLFACGECGCSITSETQKGYNYYRCTKKKDICSQPYIREEELTKQISGIIQKVSLPNEWADNILKELDKEKEQAVQDNLVFVQNLKRQIMECKEKLDKLLDAHLEGVIAREEYVSKKQKLLNQKIELSEKLKNFEQKGNHWLERAKKFILEAKQAKNVSSGDNLCEKRDVLKKIGSNRLLQERKVLIYLKKSWKILSNVSAEWLGHEALPYQRSVWLRGQDSNLRHPR